MGAAALPLAVADLVFIFLTCFTRVSMALMTGADRGVLNMEMKASRLLSSKAAPGSRRPQTRARSSCTAAEQETSPFFFATTRPLRLGGAGGGALFDVRVGRGRIAG